MTSLTLDFIYEQKYSLNIKVCLSCPFYIFPFRCGVVVLGCQAVSNTDPVLGEQELSTCHSPALYIYPAGCMQAPDTLLK